MRSSVIVVLSILFLACDPVPTQTVAERAVMDMETNEALTAAHLRAIVSAQVQAQALAVVDCDGDGWGEFLFLDELSGARPTRTPGKSLRMPLLIDEFKHRGVGGYVEVHGYLFRLFLPRGNGEFAEQGESDAALSEEHWCCYAWPVEYGRTGRRSFYVDEHGTVYAKEAPALSGGHVPERQSALGGGGDNSTVSWDPLTPIAEADGTPSAPALEPDPE